VKTTTSRVISKTGNIQIPGDLRIKHNLFDGCSIQMVSTDEGLLLLDPLSKALADAGAVRVTEANQ
jgi:hypothetical protein